MSGKKQAPRGISKFQITLPVTLRREAIAKATLLGITLSDVVRQAIEDFHKNGPSKKLWRYLEEKEKVNE